MPRYRQSPFHYLPRCQPDEVRARERRRIWKLRLLDGQATPQMRGLIWEKECSSNSMVTADGFHGARRCRWTQFGKLCGTNLLAFAAVWACKGLAVLHRSQFLPRSDFTGEDVLPRWKPPKVSVIWPQFTLAARQACSLSISKKTVISGLVFWEVWRGLLCVLDQCVGRCLWEFCSG